MERDALRAWLLDRLEACRFWPADDPRILSSGALADAGRHDTDFLAVAELFVSRAIFDLEALVADLVTSEFRTLPGHTSLHRAGLAETRRLGGNLGRSSGRRT